MKKLMCVVAVSAALFAGEASAKGCLAGAAVGGVAGHVAGNHGVLGAAGGCVAGRMIANRKDKQRARAEEARRVEVGRQEAIARTRANNRDVR